VVIAVSLANVAVRYIKWGRTP